MTGDVTGTGTGVSAEATGLTLAMPGEAGPLAAFLERLLRFDRAAVVRLRTAPAPAPVPLPSPTTSAAAAPAASTTPAALALFARLPLGDPAPLVMRTLLLAPDPATGPTALDLTVSAGQLLDALAPLTSAQAVRLPLPPAVTGPAWAGLLPPRSGWQRLDALPAAPLAAAVRAAVTEFRRAAEQAVPAQADGVSVLTKEDAAEGIWSRRVHPSGVTVRMLHAAQLSGLLHPSGSVTVHRHPSWLRLSTPHGAVIARQAPAPGTGLGLTLTPTR